MAPFSYPYIRIEREEKYLEAEFIAEFEVTLEKYQEWSENPKGAQAVREKKRGVYLRIAILVCSVMITILGILLQNYFEVMMGIVFGIIAIDRLFFMTKRVAKRQYSSFLKRMGVEQWIRKVELGEKIQVIDGIQTMEYDYLTGIRMTEEGEYRCLWINQDTIIRIPKGSFIKGTEEEAAAWVIRKSQERQKAIEDRETE